MKKDSHTECPIARVATLLSDPWTMLIVRDLIAGKMRFTDLERSLEGISSRTLTSKLKNLEDGGIVLKADTYYAITKKGLGLKKVLGVMSEYGEKYCL